MAIPDTDHSAGNLIAKDADANQRRQQPVDFVRLGKCVISFFHCGRRSKRCRPVLHGGQRDSCETLYHLRRHVTRSPIQELNKAALRCRPVRRALVPHHHQPNKVRTGGTRVQSLDWKLALLASSMVIRSSKFIPLVTYPACSLSGIPAWLSIERIQQLSP